MQPTGGKRPPSINTSVLTVHFYTNVVGTLAMTPRDYAALTPLIWSHVNPYGRFDLDMNARIALA